MHWGGPGFILAIIAISTVGWVITSWIRAKHGYPLEGEWGGTVTKQEPEANRKIEPSISGAAPVCRNNIGNECLLNTLCHSVKDSVRCKKCPRMPAGARPRKSVVHSGVQQPSANDERLASELVRQRTTENTCSLKGASDGQRLGPPIIFT